MKSLIENSNTSSTSTSNVVQILKGIIIAFIFTLVLLFIFSIFLTYTNIQETTIAPVIIIITAISILAGASISSIKIKKNGILNGGMIGFFYIFVVYFFSSLIQTGFNMNVYTIVMIICSILAGMIGGIVGVNIKK